MASTRFTAFAECANATDHLAQRVGDELLRRVDGDAASLHLRVLQREATDTSTSRSIR